MCTGPRSNIKLDVLSQDLVKSRSHEIGSLNYRIALKFDRHVGNTEYTLTISIKSPLATFI